MKDNKKKTNTISVGKKEVNAEKTREKRQIIKRNEIPGVVLGIILLGILMYGVVINQKKYNSLKSNWKYTDGIINELYLGTRASWRLRYNYFIDGNIYEGRGHWYPNSDTLSVGDTIEIVYDTTNVSYSRVARDARW